MIILIRHGFDANLSNPVLEWTLDLLSRNRIGEYDLYGVGFLRRNYWTGGIIH
jgi:hypothetical protein